MRTSNKPLLGIIGSENTRLVIPAYQRAYSWKRRQCEELWLDIFRAARAEARHFTGTVLYTPETDETSGVKRIAIIDGQQRITSVSLIIAALVRHLEERSQSLDGMSADELRKRFLLLGEDESIPSKLVPSRRDRAPYFAIARTSMAPTDAPERVRDNLAFFAEQMAQPDFDAEALWRGLRNLTVIAAEVGNADQAQLIFESLNSKGLPLTTADLVRNYLLLAETHEIQTRLYEEYWKPIEGLFVPDPGSLRLDNAIQGWLSIRFRKVRAHGPGEVYSVFKRYVEDEYVGTTEDLLRELRNFCLVWAENYHYHAVKKYRSSFSWAVNGAPTLTSGYAKKKASNKAYAQSLAKTLDRVDGSL